MRALIEVPLPSAKSLLEPQAERLQRGAAVPCQAQRGANFTSCTETIHIRIFTGVWSWASNKDEEKTRISLKKNPDTAATRVLLRNPPHRSIFYFIFLIVS